MFAVVSVVCCQVVFPASACSLVQSNLTEGGVSEYDRESSIRTTSCPTASCCAIVKNKRKVNPTLITLGL